MEPFPTEYHRYVEQTPGFENAVAAAKEATPQQPTVVVSLSQFHDDPIRLYACALFAHTSGVYLTFAPGERA